MATSGNTFNMTRFAFDIFEYTLSRFNIKIAIPPPQCSANSYEHPDFIHVISTGVIVEQLQNRDLWRRIFEKQFKLNGLKNFEHISELLEDILEEMFRSTQDFYERAIGSMSLINELNQFRYSKMCNSPLFFNNLASLWNSYIDRFRKEFETTGGFSNIYLSNKTVFRELDEIVDTFIHKYCLSYSTSGVSELFIDIFDYCQIKTACGSSIDIEDVFSLRGLELYFGKELTISSNTRKSLDEIMMPSEMLVNTDLEVHTHGKLPRASVASTVVKGTSSEKRDTASSIKEASVTFPVDAKLNQKCFRELSPKQVKGGKKLSTQIDSSEGQSKSQGFPAGSPINSAGQSEGCGSLAVTQASLHCRDSSRIPECQNCFRELTQKQVKGGKALRTQIDSSGQSKSQGPISGSPINPSGQSEGCGSLAVTPANLHRRGSSRLPEGISRMQLKRLKYLQPKKTQ